MAASAAYANTPIAAAARLATANTARDGTGALGTAMMNVYTAAGLGARIDNISISALGTTTAGMVRLYVFNGTATQLIREIPVLATTPSGTVQAFAALVQGLALILPAGSSLRASTHNAEQFDVVVTLGGAF